MEFIIIILVIVIVILSTYLFLLKSEVNNLSKEIDYIKSIDTNTLIHSKNNLKGINNIISKINILLKETKEIELDYNKKNKELKKMMTNIAHDLRTPLTSALGYIDIIQKSNISEEEKKKELKIIEERLKRLEELINSFFEFSKIISNNTKLQLEKINIVSVLENSIAAYYDDYKKSDREIIFDCNYRKIIVNSNKILLMRVFDNLISNAHKHSVSNLDIKVVFNDKLKIIFMNDLLDSNLNVEKIFDEFYTVDISRTKKGTGLGLAIAKKFTEQLGGNIYAKKEKEKLKITVEF